jgi:hypothetical protein
MEKLLVFPANAKTVKTGRFLQISTGPGHVAHAMH